MNAAFSRQLALLVQEPPSDLDPMTVIKIREDLVRATDRGDDQFADLPEYLQEQLRDWPRYKLMRPGFVGGSRVMEREWIHAPTQEQGTLLLS